MKIEVGHLVLEFLRADQTRDGTPRVAVNSNDCTKGPSITEAEWPFVRASIDEMFRREKERRDRCRPA